MTSWLRRVDPAWAEPGVVGEWSDAGGSFIVFAVVTVTVDNADIIILDANVRHPYQKGVPMTISWEADLWQKAKFV